MRLAINKEAAGLVSIEYKMSGWKIFMIIAGSIIAIALIVLVCWCCCKAHKKKKLEKGYRTIGAAEFLPATP